MTYPANALPPEASPVTGTVMLSVAVPSTSLVSKKSKTISDSSGQNYPERRAVLIEP